MRSVTLPAKSDPDRRAQTRAQIVDATRSLLASGEALVRLSIGRIVSAAGVSRATFYLHFRGKRELIAALTEREVGTWKRLATPFLSDPFADRPQLERALEGILSLWREHRAVLAALVELAEYDEETREGWRDAVMEIARSLAAAVRLRRPELTTAQANELGLLMVWAGERFLHQESGTPHPDRDRLLVWSLGELVWKLLSD